MYLYMCIYIYSYVGVCIYIYIYIYIYHNHNHEGLGVFLVPWSSRCSWSLHLFLGRPMFLCPFGLYCSSCFGILFVSIPCTCFSHFSWYCFISFTMFCAPVFFTNIVPEILWILNIHNFNIIGVQLLLLLLLGYEFCLLSTIVVETGLQWILGWLQVRLFRRFQLFAHLEWIV